VHAKEIDVLIEPIKSLLVWQRYYVRLENAERKRGNTLTERQNLEE